MMYSVLPETESSMSEPFGGLLRKHRVAAAMSMGELARRANYSKSYLSKIENSVKPPNATVARLCDNVLDAGGVLIEAARERPVADVGLGTLDRRRVLAGAGSLLGVALTGGSRPVADELVVSGLTASFEHLRELGRQTGPTIVLEPLIAQTRAAQSLALANREPTRSRLLVLTARMAEYVGWLSQEDGDEQCALWWTRNAANLARAGGDREIVTYALVREAGLAMYRQDAATTIALAELAQDQSAGPYVLGMAARRAAQGHALAGDQYACERALDHAHALLLDPSVVDTRAYPVLGSTAPDPVGLARGWALVDLGRCGEAAAVLDRALAATPAANRRGRARVGARRSLAYALSGEIDQSCLTMTEVIDDVAHVDSATVRLDLRELSRTLSRWRDHRTVRDLHPRLSRLLQRDSAAP
jgi:transcriptional regulator with XRE-family HTH domain